MSDSNQTATNKYSTLSTILFGGLLAGSAEVLWMLIYGQWSHSNVWQISQQIFATVAPTAASDNISGFNGLLLHFVLSIVIVALLLPLFKRIATQRFPVLILACWACLGLIWALNFMVILPVLNPFFVTALPLSVTLISKLLFGSALAIYLRMTR